METASYPTQPPAPTSRSVQQGRAGRTTLVDLMKLGVERPETLVDISRLPLTEVKAAPGGGAEIGAMVRNADLAHTPAPHLRAYPVETVVAEKLEVMVTLGMANSRPKDFYDLWLISQTFELRHSVLVDAVRRTFERRGTALPSDMPVGLTDDFVEAWATQWRAFLGRERMAAAPETFAVVVANLRSFLIPLVETSEGERTWFLRGPWLLSAPSTDALEQRSRH